MHDVDISTSSGYTYMKRLGADALGAVHSANFSGKRCMATLPEQFSSRPEQQYATLLEVSQAIAAHQSLTALFQDLGRRLHTVLNFNYLSLILHDPVHQVMRLHTLHFDGIMTIQPGMEFGMEDSPSAEVWRTQAPLTIADAEKETRFRRATSSVAARCSCR